MATDYIARALAVKASKQGSYEVYESKNNFPVIGKENQLYFDKDKEALYFWNSESFSYKILVASNVDTATTEVINQSVQECIVNTVFDCGGSV